MRSGSLVGLVGWVFCFVMQFLCIVWFDLMRLFALVVVPGWWVCVWVGGLRLGYCWCLVIWNNVVACVGA